MYCSQPWESKTMLAYSSNVDTVLTESSFTRAALVHCLVFRAGCLKRERAFFFVGSWMELVPSNITAFWYFVYWFLLRVSTDHTTDRLIHYSLQVQVQQVMLMLLSYVWVILSQNSFLVVPAQVQLSSTF